MHKKWIVILVMLFLASGWGLPVYADTIFLKNGGIVDGKIIYEGNFSITIQEGGKLRKIRRDEIDFVEKEDIAAAGKTESLDIVSVEGVSEEKNQLIIELMEVSGIRKDLEQKIQILLNNVPADKRGQLEYLLDIKEIIRTIIPVYDRHFSPEELKEIVRFHKSPAGAKMINLMPTIAQEIAQETVRYFQEKMQSAPPSLSP